MKKLLIIMLVVMVSLLIVACDNNNQIEHSENNNNQVIDNEYVKMYFSDMYISTNSGDKVSEKLKQLNNQKVVLTGYATNQNSLDGSFIYLTENQYTNSPFLTIDDPTKQEIVQIYMADGSKIEYVTDKLEVYGSLKVEEQLDTEGNVTQARIYADKITILPTNDNKQNINNYYNLLSKNGTLSALQLLQINMEYLSNPKYLNHLGENKKDIVEQVLKDATLYIQSTEGVSHIDYMNNHLNYLKNYNDTDNTIKKINDDLIKIYEDEIAVLKTFCEIAERYMNKNLTNSDAEKAYIEFTALNDDNIETYNKLNSWFDNLRKY